MRVRIRPWHGYCFRREAKPVENGPDVRTTAKKQEVSMVRTVDLNDGGMEYIVDYDADGNGRKDEIAFDDEENAKEFESCYVKNNLNACTGQIPPTRVKLFASNGLPAKQCNVGFASPINELKGQINRLGDNLANVSTATLLNMAGDLYDAVRNRPDKGVMVELAAKYINILNDVSTKGRLNSRQVDLLARLLVNHAGDIKGVVSGSLDLFANDISKSLLNMVSKKFETCVADDFVQDQISCLDDVVDLSERELREVAREFTGFSTNGCVSSRGRELADDRVIQGIPCMKGSFVDFYENGNLEVATLGEDHTVEDQTFKRGAMLYFFDDGELDPSMIPDPETGKEVRRTSDF